MKKKRSAQSGFAENCCINFKCGIFDHVHIPESIGYLRHEETNTTISVYAPISFFKRLMLKWCFGLKYKNNKN